MFEGYIAAKFANKMFEKDVFKTIRNHALIGSILLMIPDFGFGTLFFIGILWHMYSSICDKVGISFSKHFWSLVGVGMFVNIVINFAIDIILSFFFFLEGFIVYFQFYMSGKMFVDSIKELDIEDEIVTEEYIQIETTQNEQPKLIAPTPTTQEPIKQAETESPESIKDNLDNLADLLHAGVLSSEEYAELELIEKKKLLNNTISQPTESVENNKIALLRSLKSLLDEGILSQEEYQSQKENILWNESTPLWTEGKTTYETLLEMKSLLDEGALTQKEFDYYKKLLLDTE